MDNDVAIFLDLDNVVIGAIEVNLAFDVNLVLDRIRSLTQGRIVLLRAYGDWRQREDITRKLATAGFELQSTVRLSSMGKNLADMQMVVDAMSTLIDGQHYATYVLITGDRDFAPLVQALRKRGKQVIGVGIKHASSQTLVRLCDEYIFYDRLAASARQQLEDQIEEHLRRALDQLLQEEVRVPASLLKQRIQALSKGALGRTSFAKGSFHKLLERFPEIVRLETEGTTLYVARPGDGATSLAPSAQSGRQTFGADAGRLLQQALSELLNDSDRVPASLVKQRMQALSGGVFNQELLGEPSFRGFLDRFSDLVQIQQEGSTLYVTHASEPTEVAPVPAVSNLSSADARDVLARAAEELLNDQPRVRASLLKQRMMELSDGRFDELKLGAKSFRAFLEKHGRLVQVDRKGSTLFVSRPPSLRAVQETHLKYRSELKKRGLRVVPSAVRLTVLRDLVALLEDQEDLPWGQLIGGLATYYQRNSEQHISKSYVNDVLRVARRAQVIGVRDGGTLATAPVRLLLNGERNFQDAVIRCDLAYLNELLALGEPLHLEQAALALYESNGRTRYLKVILNRYSDNGQMA